MQKLLILFLLVISGACGKKEKPQEVLTDAQLSSLLVEIYLGEARTDNIPYVRDSAVKYFIPFEQKLLKAQGVSEAALKSTYAYYIAHPKELERVYDSVIDTLVLREQRAAKVQLEVIKVPLKVIED